MTGGKADHAEQAVHLSGVTLRFTPASTEDAGSDLIIDFLREKNIA